MHRSIRLQKSGRRPFKFTYPPLNRSIRLQKKRSALLYPFKFTYPPLNAPFNRTRLSAPVQMRLQKSGRPYLSIQIYLSAFECSVQSDGRRPLTYSALSRLSAFECTRSTSKKRSALLYPFKFTYPLLNAPFNVTYPPFECAVQCHFQWDFKKKRSKAPVHLSGR